MYKEVIFDLETKKLFSDIEGTNPADLGISIVSLYSRKIEISSTEVEEINTLNEVEGKIESFFEKDFEKMWPIFEDCDRVIGFNSLGFDVPALAPHAPFSFKKLIHFDIMHEVKQIFGRRISLDAIAKETLDRQKIDTGLEAVYYWQKHDKKSLDKLQKYCEDDVLITKEIYDFVLKNGYLLFKDKWNTLRKLEMNFSYPKQPNSDKQIGLF